MKPAPKQIRAGVDGQSTKKGIHILSATELRIHSRAKAQTESESRNFCGSNTSCEIEVYTCGHGVTMMYAKRSRSKALDLTDDYATNRRLYSLLLMKEPNEDDDFGWTVSSEAPASSAIGPSAASQTASTSVRKSLPGRAASVQSGGSGSGSQMSGSQRKGLRALDDGPQALCLAVLPPAELEKERETFMNRHCTDETRLDVRDWVSRVFNLMVKHSAESQVNASKFDRRRRARSGGGTSDSGTSGATLHAAGQSMATTQKAPSLISAESLVVHHGQGVEILSGHERMRSYLAGDIPELMVHVDAFIEAKTEKVSRYVDKELADKFLKMTSKKLVFGPQENFLRWQNARRAIVQKILEDSMPKWIWEAVNTWDQLEAMEGREKNVSDTDFVYDYLTKRAAHIDNGKLATEIPIFKPLYASHSLPPMWRDKYLS